MIRTLAVLIAAVFAFNALPAFAQSTTDKSGSSMDKKSDMDKDKKASKKKSSKKSAKKSSSKKSSDKSDTTK